MEIGYLNVSPLDAFTLPIIMQTIFSITMKATIGMPTIMKHRGKARTIYSSSEIWKFRDDLPFWSTHWDSSFRDNQQISGPIIPPKGKKNPAKAERWQNIAQFLSESDNTRISFIFPGFCIKTSLFSGCCMSEPCQTLKIGR